MRNRVPYNNGKDLQYRTKVFEAGQEILARVLEMSTKFHDTYLEKRIGCYKKTGKEYSCYEQCLVLTEIRADDPERENISLQVFRTAAGHVDRAFRHFFRRVKEKERVGFSRFRRDAGRCAIEETLVRSEFRENREGAR